MAAKSQAEPQPKGRQSRRREILGILLLAFGLFGGVSLLSMQLGTNRMMGPGGAATAAGLYTLAGFGAYLLIAATIVVAVRCFRARPLVGGFVEGTASVMLLASLAVLLHLPFAGRAMSLHGPGGLLGQWLGEVTASFIGAAGAALAAATALFVSLLLVSAIRMHEVVVVVGWALGQARRGIWAGLRAAGRVALAMFPEKDDTHDDARDDAKDGAADELGEADADGEPAWARASRGDADQEHEVADEDIRVVAELRALPPVHADADESLDDDGVRVGAARGLSEALAGERAAFAEIVAEVAAAEPVAPSPADDPEPEAALAEDDAPLVSLPAVVAAQGPAAPAQAAPPAPADGPIIVESSHVRQQREMAAAGLAAELAARATAAEGPGFIKLGEGAFKLPGTDLLEYIPPQAHDMDKQGLYDMAERLEQAMSNYGVRGKVKEIHMGPVVTMYEFAPAPGTRTGKVANLEKDLAMALEAQAVRIVAPIPGKAVVGVEVPNKTRETVYLKEILQDECFVGASSKLQVGLGKDIKGAPVSVNLSKMPHLLVAGTTGSGKSVAVNGMITSLLYNASPEDVRFIMVDPKMLELSIYEGIPHLLLPVVTDPKKANLALRWAVEEMERRYELLAKTGVRDIASYNSKLEQGEKKVFAEVQASKGPANKKIKVVLSGADGTEQEVELDPEEAIPSSSTPAADAGMGAAAEAEADTDGVVDAEVPSDEDLSGQAAALQAAREGAEPPPRKLPYIVIVIDEFADLMMVAPKDVETSVARIAQKARAVGIHLLLATQRPSVDVITGLIKANFPSRMAFQVASKIDSRTILDQQGAENLLGMGDMLFTDRGQALRRIHGALVTDVEIKGLVDFLKKQGQPVYDMDILKPREEEAGDESGFPADEGVDPCYDLAVKLVCETRMASVSMIQRRLQIGFNRASRLVERMEREGIVGAANGSKPREVIANAL